MSYVFAPRAPATLTVVGTVRRFPVRRVYCIGRNYAAHAREMGGDPDREPPFFFMKPGDAVQAVTSDKTARHPYPPGTEDYHHELELVAALHKGGRDIPADKAMACVFGYAAGLDMTRRDLQGEAKKLGRPWEVGKAADCSAVIGEVVQKAKAGDVLAAPLRLTVNGALRQEASTGDMIWSLPEQISILSRFYTLAPGDVIMTGTPEGVAAVKRGDAGRAAALIGPDWKRFCAFEVAGADGGWLIAIVTCVQSPPPAVQIYLPIAELPVSIFLILGMAAAVGFISGMFGVGGGFLMTPLLVFLGIPPAVAVATGAAQVAAASMTGVITSWRRRAMDVRLGTWLAAGGLVGTVLGVMFFNAMRRAGYFELVLVVSYVTLLGTVGGTMLVESARSTLFPQRVKAARPRRADGRRWFETLPVPLAFPQSTLVISIVPILSLGVFIGFAGALLGIGGGFVVVPALIYLFRVPASIVIGTSLWQILLTMIVATILHAVTNQSVDLVLAAILIVGSVIGAQFGARVGQTLRGEHFRLLLAVLIFGVAVRFAVEVVVKPQEPFTVGQHEMRP
jgi:uncharacterized protein